MIYFPFIYLCVCMQMHVYVCLCECRQSQGEEGSVIIGNRTTGCCDSPLVQRAEFISLSAVLQS